MIRLPRSAVMAFALCGCASVATQPRPYDRPSPAEEAPSSLLPSEGASLEDAEIARMLDAHIALPKRIRVAVLHLEHRSADYGWLYAGERTPATWLFAELFTTLRKSERAYDVSYLPSMLIPQKLTVAHLREAAARYQADALLIFRTECRTYQQYRVFSASQAKAYCLADAALLDVRRGVMPFTSRSTQEFQIPEGKSDLDLLETVRRSEKMAAEAAMAENGGNLSGFLAGLP